MTYARNNPASFAAAKATTAVARPSGAFGVTALNLLLMLGAVLFLAGYIAMNNLAAAKAFSIRTEEQRLADLQDQRERLDLAVVSAQSMDVISAGVGTLGLVPVAQVDYVEGTSGAVAVK